MPLMYHPTFFFHRPTIIWWFYPSNPLFSSAHNPLPPLKQNFWTMPQ
jgi:hypothetical protein